jgi:hypothetical protein
MHRAATAFILAAALFAGMALLAWLVGPIY